MIIKYLSVLRTTEDDSTTQKKVKQMLETADEVKWKAAGRVEEEEEEQKVCVGRSCVMTLHSLPSDCDLLLTSSAKPPS